MFVLGFMHRKENGERHSEPYIPNVLRQYCKKEKKRHLWDLNHVCQINLRH